MYSEYLLIGEVLKPQGIHGFVKIRPYTDDASRFLDLENVYLKEGDTFCPCTIEKTEIRKDGNVYCVLNHAENMNDAEKQRGWKLYVDRMHAVKLETGRYFISDLLGCSVVDRHGVLLGHIVDVLQPGANDVYQIKLIDGRMMYIPVLPFVILQVQIMKGIITVNDDRLQEVAVIED